MFYTPMYYSYSYPFANPYYGFGFGGGYNSGINAIGSQFNNQSLVNTGTMTGTTQTQSPVNVWGW